VHAPAKALQLPRYGGLYSVVISSSPAQGAADNPFSARIFIASLDGNPRDTAGLVDHSSFSLASGVFLILLAEIGLRIGFMAGDTLQPRLGRQRSKILAKSLARRRRRRIGGSRNSR